MKWIKDVEKLENSLEKGYNCNIENSGGNYGNKI